MINSVNQVNSKKMFERIKPVNLNILKNIEKKRKFCDRPLFKAIEKHSGRQLKVELQTVIYEYFKTYPVEFLSEVGKVVLIGTPTVDLDQKDANMEIQYHLLLLL